MWRVVFIHPDLGIGGAERAMVDAALALKSSGNHVEFVTAHHDDRHCFTETKNGTFKVSTVGDWLPRHIFGFGHAIFAYLRMIYATIYWLVFGDVADIVICDQISAGIPFLKFSKSKVLFYCHFPDKLLAKRHTILRNWYRLPIDWIEEKTTGMADKILVNSKFTAGIFKEHFTSLKHISPQVLYPVPDFTQFDQACPALPDHLQFENKTVFLSLNRYERKKNIGLAIEALAKTLSECKNELRKPHLVIAGGYDERVLENLNHHDELADYTRRLGIEQHVTFLRSITDSLKHSLLKSSQCLIYTPENEHFGIVPVEAMYCKCAVIAVNSGGPLETVVNEETGFLCPPNADSFAENMMKIVRNPDLARKLGERGHARVIKHFSFKSYSKNLTDIVKELLNE